MSFLRKYKWFRRLCGGHWHYNKINEDLWWSNSVSGWSRNFYMPRTEYFITETNYYEKTAIVTLKTEIWDNGYDKSYRKKYPYIVRYKIPTFEPKKRFFNKFCMINGVRPPHPWEDDHTWSL